jgi:predicted dehydrogenase
MRNWYYFNWLSGDHIVEQHIHNLDVVNWIKGTHPASANGMGGRQLRDVKDQGEIFDHHFVEYTYADGSKMFSQCRHIPGCWNEVAEYVHGTKGTCNVGSGAIEGENRSRYRGPNPDPYQVEHDVLFASIRDGRPIQEAENGALSTMTAILGRMATYSGKPIAWEDALASNRSLAPAHYAFDADPPVMPDDTGHYAIAVPGQTQVV